MCLYRQGEATAKEVLNALPNPPSYSAVRALLAKLEDKGHITHRQDGARYIYRTIVAHEDASSNAINRVLKTFFNDSPSQLVNALLGMKGEHLSESEISEIDGLLNQARKHKAKKN